MQELEFSTRPTRGMLEFGFSPRRTRRDVWSRPLGWCVSPAARRRGTRCPRRLCALAGEASLGTGQESVQRCLGPPAGCPFTVFCFVFPD